jgi:hypothetical protein
VFDAGMRGAFSYDMTHRESEIRIRRDSCWNTALQAIGDSVTREWVRLLFVAGLLSTTASAMEPTWTQVGETVYGARPDDRGPISGGEGYIGVVTAGHYQVDNVDSLLVALAGARAGEVVFIPGESVIDLTARIYIEGLVLEIPAGVTLAGNRGQEGSQGPLLVSDALKTPVMIRAMGPGVRITGLQIQGPNPKRYLAHHRRSFQEGKGRSYYYEFPTSDGIVAAHDSMEVDNCEISGFAHAGIFLKAGVGHEIHHNFIHHNQYNGLGYGVTHDSASSLIEYNHFDFNRHSIAGTGRPGCSYVARHNVELGTSLSHCFDMHGGRDRKDGTDIAGTSILIHNNTFRAPKRAVVIRGTPEGQCEVKQNWFPVHESESLAVRASERTTVHDNLYGEDEIK